MRYLIRDLSPGQAYALQVRSVSGTDASDWSRVFNFTTDIDAIAPMAPTGLTVVVKGTSFACNWNAVTLNSDGTPANDFDHYVVRVESPNSGASAQYNVIGTKFELSFENNVATFGTPQGTVKISVAAVDALSNSSAFGTSVTASNPAPAAPTNLSGQGAQDAVSLRWDAIADTDQDLQDYRVYSGTTAGFTPAAGNLVWRGRSTAALIPNTAYSTDAFYKVAAYDVFNTPSTFVTTGALRPTSPFTVDTTAPAQVTGVTAVITTVPDGSAASALVSWTASGATDLAGYAIQYREVGTTDYSIVRADKDQTKVVVTPLKAYKNYEFLVRAYDWAANYGPVSSLVTTTTAATDAIPSTPAAPTVASNPMQIQVTHTGNKAAGGALEADLDHLIVYAATSNSFTEGPTNLLGIIRAPSFTGTWPVPASAATGSNQTWYSRVVAVDKGGNKSVASAVSTGVNVPLIGSTNIADASIGTAKITDLRADLITAGSGFINDITVKSKFTLGDATTDGVIESYGYTGTTAGFRLAKSGLVINQGDIAAAALRIQIGQNLMPVQYSDFEFAPAFYTGKIGTTSGSFFINTNTAFVRSGTQSIAANGNASGTSNMSFGSNGTSSYNIPVDAGKTYILSAYIWNAATVGNPTPNLRFKLKETAAFISVSGATSITAGQWTRLSGAYTIPAGITAVTAYIDWAAFTGIAYVDQVQLEEKVGNINTPSTWTPPSFTSIDGGIFRTGEMRSTTTITVNGVAQPAWSLNMQGNAQFGDAQVRGKLIIGNVYNPASVTDPDAGNSYIQSGSYVPGSFGWIIKSDGFAEFRNLAINSLKVTTLDSPLQNVIATKLYDYMEDGTLWADRSWTGLESAAIIRKNNEAGAYSAKSLIQITGDGAVSRDATGVSSGIAFEPEVLYRVTARIRQVTGSSTGALVNKASIGLLGYDDSGNLCGWDGTTSMTKQYMVAADKQDLPIYDGNAATESAGWQTYIGFIKGRGVIGTPGEAPDMYAPAKVHESVRFLVPYVRLNEGNTTYVAQLDAFTIETFEAGAQRKIATNDTGTRSITIENIVAEPEYNHAIRFYTGEPEEIRPGLISHFSDNSGFDSLSLIISPPVSSYANLDYEFDNVIISGTNANMIYNNSFIDGIAGWVPWSATYGTIEQGTEGREDDTSLLVTVLAGASATTAVGAYYNMDPGAFDGVIGSARLIASAYIKPLNRDIPIEGRIYLRSQDEAGVMTAVDAGYAYSVRTTCTQGEWTRVVMSSKGRVPIPADLNFVQIGWYNNTSTTVGDQFLIDDVQLEVYDYDKTVRKNWMTNPNFVDSPVTGTPNGMTVYTSSGSPAATGTRTVVSGVMKFNSVAFTVPTTGTQRFGSYIDVYPEPSMEDRTFSVEFTKSGGSASVRTYGYVDCYDDSAAIVYSGATVGAAAYSTAASGTITYTIPGDSTITRVRLYYWVDAQNTATSGVNVTFTKPMLEDGPDKGTFFTGATSGAQWDGTADASASTMLVANVVLPTVDQMASEVKSAAASQTLINTETTMARGALFISPYGSGSDGLLPPTSDAYSLSKPSRPDVPDHPMLILGSQNVNWLVAGLDYFNSSTGNFRSHLDIRAFDQQGAVASPGLRLFSSSDETSPGRWVAINGAGQYFFSTYDKYDNTDPDTYMTTQDVLFSGFLQSRGAPPWQTLPLVAGWNYYSGSYTAGFYKNHDKIYMRGIVLRTGTTIAAASGDVKIGTLPVGWRPAQSVYIKSHAWSSASGGSCLVTVGVTGDVSVRSNDVAIASGSSFVTLDGLEFSTSADTAYTPPATPAADTTAPAAPSGFSIAAYSSGTTTGAYTLRWTNPSTSDFAGVKIIWRSDRYPSITIGSGQKTLTTDGKIVTVNGGLGSAKSFLHTGLPVNRYIYYRMVAFDKSGNHSGYISGRRYLLASPFVINTTSSGSYRDGFGGGWRTDSDDVYQGEATGFNDNHRGLFFYGSNIYAKLNAGGVRRNPTKMTALLYRQNSSHGIAAAEVVNLGTHIHTSRPPGVPSIIDQVDSITSLSRGQQKIINLPSKWYAGFATGVRRGIGIYSSLAADYLIMSGHSRTTANGRLTIYHRG